MIFTTNEKSTAAPGICRRRYCLLGEECAVKKRTDLHNFHFNVWCERLGDEPLRKAFCDAAHPPSEICTRSFDASNVDSLSGDRSPETPQPVHVVDSRGACARLPRRHLSCGRLRGAAVHHCSCLDPQRLVRRTLWLISSSSKSVSGCTAKSTSLRQEFHCVSVFAGKCFLLLAVCFAIVFLTRPSFEVRTLCNCSPVVVQPALWRASSTMMSGTSHKRARPGQVR